MKLAIVGVGWAGTRHAEAVQEMAGDLQIHCFVDSDPGYLAETAERFGIATRYTSLDDALADPDVEAVDIATPHALHEPMTIAAAEAGRHVLVEKPMALVVAQATRMIEAADSNGVKLFVAENASYEPHVTFLREVVRTGIPIGEITAASVTAGFRPKGRYGYPGRRAWLAEPGLGGTGSWMLHGIHTVAALRRVFGEVRRVYVQEHRTSSFTRSDVEGTMSCLLTMESGLPVWLAQSPETRFRGNTGGFVLHGERGSIRARADIYELFAEDEDPASRPYPRAPHDSYVAELKAFVEYVNGDDSAPTTGMSERRSLAVVQAGMESAKSGQPIDLHERFGAI